MHTPQVVRRGPLSDADLLQVTYGCPWGRCHFCNLYEREQFGVVPLEHIAEDLDEIAATLRWRAVRTDERPSRACACACAACDEWG